MPTKKNYLTRGLSMKEEAIKQRNKRYNKYVDAVSPQTSAVKSLTKAFVIGGFTCVIGEFIADMLALGFPNMELTMIANITSMILVTVAIFITGFGWYDVIARHGGAGSFLPITGFANAMASASIEYKSEGFIFGTSTKMFTVVGPVVVNGVVWSTVAGILRYLIWVIFL